MTRTHLAIFALSSVLLSTGCGGVEESQAAIICEAFADRQNFSAADFDRVLADATSQDGSDRNKVFDEIEEQCPDVKNRSDAAYDALAAPPPSPDPSPTPSDFSTPLPEYVPGAALTGFLLTAGDLRERYPAVPPQACATSDSPNGADSVAFTLAPGATLCTARNINAAFRKRVISFEIRFDEAVSEDSAIQSALRLLPADTKRTFTQMQSEARTFGGCAKVGLTSDVLRQERTRLQGSSAPSNDGVGLTLFSDPSGPTDGVGSPYDGTVRFALIFIGLPALEDRGGTC